MLVYVGTLSTSTMKFPWFSGVFPYPKLLKRWLAYKSRQFVDIPSPIAPKVPKSMSKMSTKSAHPNIIAMDFFFSLLPPTVSPFLPSDLIFLASFDLNEEKLRASMVERFLQSKRWQKWTSDYEWKQSWFAQTIKDPDKCIYMWGGVL